MAAARGLKTEGSPFPACTRGSSRILAVMKPACSLTFVGTRGHRFSISWLAALGSTMTITIGGSTMRSAIDGPGTLLSPEEVRAYQPEPPTTGPGFAMIRARRRMVETGQWDGARCMGRRWPVGCVALEITQRCNLDCTLCYLSETAEAVKDLPLGEIFRRIGTLFGMYGPNTPNPDTGGGPTLRPPG